MPASVRPFARTVRELDRHTTAETVFGRVSEQMPGVSLPTVYATLDLLEEEGIVERQTFPEVPPRVEYALTEKGRALVPIIESMRSYGTEWLGAEDTCSEAPEAPEAVPALV